MKKYPWEDKSNKKYIRFQLRLTRPEHTKLKFIVKKLRGKNMQSFCLEHLNIGIDKKIQEITKEE